MGFFSFLTSDTGESISNIDSSRKTKTVYMLLPHGEDPIEETAYEGYGEFGGVDCYDFLARMNINSSVILGLELDNESDLIREIGIVLDLGYQLYLGCDGNFYCTSKAGQIVTECLLGDSAILVKGSETFLLNDEHLTIYEHEIRGHITKRTSPRAMYPLKFSFSKFAKYDDCPAALNCPDQGFFYKS